MKPATPVKVKQPKKKPEPVAPFPEHGHKCLNCGHKLSDNFCSMCGQSTATHRLSITHFVLHDMVHSFWHIDRGIFYTLKEVLVRPGHAAIDYIRGKRAGKFPILTLLLLLMGLALWLYAYHAPKEPQGVVQIKGWDNEFGKQLSAFAEHNVKWILLSLLPIGSLSTLIVFRRTRLNFTEHLVVNSYVFGGLLVVLVIIRLVMLGIPGTADFLSAHNDQIGLVFYLVGYWQAYHKAYRLPGMLWRYGALWLLNVGLMIVLLAVILGTTLLLRPDLIPPGILKVPAADSTSALIDTVSD